MPFDCDKMKEKCNAVCCGPVPMLAEVYRRLKHKLIRPIKEEIFFIDSHLNEQSFKDPGIAENVELVVSTAEDMRCPFLTWDLKCNIYDERPFVCREFGKESHLYLTCSYQDKDGNPRCRQQRRCIDRQQVKEHHRLNNKLNILR